MVVSIGAPQAKHVGEAILIVVQVKDNRGGSGHGIDFGDNTDAVGWYSGEIIGKQKHSARHGHNGGSASHLYVGESRGFAQEQTVGVVVPPTVPERRAGHGITNHSSQ